MANEPTDRRQTPQPQRLKKRRDFLRAAKARRWSTPGFVLQARRRAADEAEPRPRIGFTASKKVGNAVERNRAKRRLRALAQAAAALARPEWDYVLIARATATATRSFAVMRGDLEQAMDRVHRDPKMPREAAGRRERGAARPSPTAPDLAAQDRANDGAASKAAE